MTTSFKVGDKVISTSSLLFKDEKQAQQIQSQIEKENQLLTEVTDIVITRTPEQETGVDLVTGAIDFNDSSFIASYGKDDASEKEGSLSTITSNMLAQVKASEIGDIGGMLVGLAKDLELSTQLEEKKGIFGLFSKAKDQLKALQIQCQSAEENIKRVVGTLENDQLKLITNNTKMKKMKEANVEYFQRLSVYVDAGKNRIKQAYEIDIPQLEERAQNGSQMELAELTTYRNNVTLFEQKIHDLDAQMSMCQSLALMLQSLTNTNDALIFKIDRTKDILVPAWSMNMTALFMAHDTEKALEHTKMADDITNKFLVEATKKISNIAVKGAEQSERAAIAIETLESMNSDLMIMLDDIRNAQKAGREYRASAEVRIGQLRDEMKNKLLDVMSTNPSYT